MKEIKAIMCDLDGTLLCEDGYVTPKTIEAIKRVKDMGILFGIATGRDIETCENLYEEWGINGLVDMIVGVNGVHLKDYNLHRDEQSHPLSGESIREIMSIFHDMNVNFCISKGGYLLMEKDDEAGRLLSKVDKIPMKVVDYDELLQEPHNKVLVVCDVEKMPAVIARAEAHPSAQYISMHTAPILYEYMDYRIAKTNGLKILMEHHNWSMDNLMVFGDANNDFDMVRDSGVGVCMINGCDRVKRVASDITRYDNNHDGIGVFLNAYFFND